MPNGGSDCCGTCWFNRKNGGEKGYSQARDNDVEPYCEIRHVLIENPFWTYCANHPHRRPNRDPIPIGPLTRHSGGGSSNDREMWIASPDTEEIRQHLLELLENFFKHVSESRYPIGPDIGQVVVRQLGEFREQRAEKHIRWLSENCPNPWADVASTALKFIKGGGLVHLEPIARSEISSIIKCQTTICSSEPLPRCPIWPPVAKICIVKRLS